MQTAQPQAGSTKTGETTVIRAFNRYSLCAELRRVRDTLQGLQDSRHPEQHEQLVTYYKTRLAELRAMLDIATEDAT